MTVDGGSDAKATLGKSMVAVAMTSGGFVAVVLVSAEAAGAVGVARWLRLAAGTGSGALLCARGGLDAAGEDACVSTVSGMATMAGAEAGA